MSAIGASLLGNPGLEVEEMEGPFQDLLDGSDAVPPEVILFDLGATRPDWAIQAMRAYPGVTVIGIDLANSKMLVLSGRESRLLTTEDLERAIEAGGATRDT